MGDKINYKRIGLLFFMLVFTFVLSLFFLHRHTYKRCSKMYDIHFTKSVFGLRKGDPVAYNGMIAGRVNDIFIYPKNIQTIVVRICMDPNFPIKTDAIAYQSTKSITGGSIINIKPGSQDAELLPSKGIPIIKSELSGLDKLTENVPNMIEKISGLTDNFGQIFEEKQRRELRESIHNLNEILKSFKTFKVNSDMLNTSLEKFVKIENLILEILNNNKKGFAHFFSNGSVSLNNFLNQGSDTMKSVRKLVESIERSPSRFIHKDPGKGVKIP